VIGKGAAVKVDAIRGSIQDSAGDTIEEVKAHREAVDGFDVGGQERLVLCKVGRRHDVQGRRGRRVAHVKGAG